MSDGHVAYASLDPCTSRLTRRIEFGTADGLRLRLAIEGAVEQVFGVKHGELLRATRGRARVALARQVAMYLAHVALRLSFTEVGELFGRDRTTVAHACRVIEDRRDDPVFNRVLELLEWAVPTLASPRQAAAAVFAWAGVR